jgi:quinol monooxygenase YgiN
MRLAILTCALLAGLGLAPVAQAQDPVPLYPDNYKVLFENDKVRVFDFRLAKGATEVMHDHPANVAVFLADFTIRFNAARRHDEDARGLNVGDTEAHGILIELKTPPKDAVTAFTRIHDIPGKEADLERHLLSLTAPTRAEAGAIRYDLYQSPDQPHEFLRHEVWASPSALEAHKRAPHLKASWDKRQREGWTTEIQLFTPVGE